MKIKRFVSDSFPEAMRQAKEQMGNEAVILNSRKYKEGGFLGLFGRYRYELTVAMDENYQNSLRPLSSDGVTGESEPEFPKTEVHNPTGTSVENSTDVILDELKFMKEMVEDLKDRIDDEPQHQLSHNGQVLFKHLISRQVDQKLASRIVKLVESRMEQENVRNKAEFKALCVGVVAEFVKKPRGIELKKGKPRIIALIGPTGVGKTTTIAKLAAMFNLINQKKVGLITVDTYRIAAVEQLKVYADIMGLSLEVVYKAGDLKVAVEKYSNRDLVFIDTAGRSPRNETQMKELVGLLGEVEPDEIILVLSATTKNEDLWDIYKRFNLIKIDKIIFTKLDETNCYGPILNIIHKTKKRLSYVTNGQNVPDDIELLDDVGLAQLIVGDDSAL